MAGMKFMMVYLMPVMMLLWFNSYSSGLTYYYFLANILTIGQTLVIRRMIDDEKFMRDAGQCRKKQEQEEIQVPVALRRVAASAGGGAKERFPTEITERCKEFPNKFSKLKITLSEFILTGVIT